MNGSLGALLAYMRNGHACNGSSVTKWQETSGVISGGNSASLRWLSLNGSARAFRCLWGVGSEAVHYVGFIVFQGQGQIHSLNKEFSYPSLNDTKQ